MCRSVPQIEATSTLTKTSFGPNCGLGTSRISVPGEGSAFTTASIVFGMRMALYLPPRQRIGRKQVSRLHFALLGMTERDTRRLLGRVSPSLIKERRANGQV